MQHILCLPATPGRAIFCHARNRFKEAKSGMAFLDACLQPRDPAMKTESTSARHVQVRPVRSSSCGGLTMSRKRILSVSLHTVLLSLRATMLQERGYEVISIVGNATEQCE